jgi:hypothetical protein
MVGFRLSYSMEISCVIYRAASKITMKELQDRIEKLGERFEPSDAEYSAEIARIRKNIVNFHGEMVLLLNYSSVNYTGLCFFFCLFYKFVTCIHV